VINESLEKDLLQLLDKQRISEVLIRYARGLDRDDPDLLRSTFHDDAIDCHGLFNKPMSEFITDVLPELRKREAQQTFLMNQAIDLEGDTAHSETYFMIVRKFPNDEHVEQSAGRFIDRLERRAGEWKIALRVVLVDWYLRADGSGFHEVVSRYNRGSRDERDASYERPLKSRDPVPSKRPVAWQVPAESSGIEAR